MPPFVLVREGSTPIPPAVCGAPRTALASDVRDRQDLRGGRDGRAVHSTSARSAGTVFLVGDIYTTLLSGAQDAGASAVGAAARGPLALPCAGQLYGLSTAGQRSRGRHGRAGRGESRQQPWAVVR
jgi:hypothetical protein